jgi:anti-anti-sigma factor
MASTSVVPSVPFFEAHHLPGDPPMVSVVGEVDLSTRDQFADVLVAALVPGRDLVVDCAGIRFIDASGIAVLLKVARAISGGRLRLVDAHGSLAHVIDLFDLASAGTNLVVERRRGTCPSAGP